MKQKYSQKVNYKVNFNDQSNTKNKTSSMGRKQQTSLSPRPNNPQTNFRRTQNIQQSNQAFQNMKAGIVSSVRPADYTDNLAVQINKQAERSDQKNSRPYPDTEAFSPPRRLFKQNSNNLTSQGMVDRRKNNIVVIQSVPTVTSLRSKSGHHNDRQSIDTLISVKSQSKKKSQGPDPSRPQAMMAYTSKKTQYQGMRVTASRQQNQRLQTQQSLKISEESSVTYNNNNRVPNTQATQHTGRYSQMLKDDNEQPNYISPSRRLKSRGGQMINKSHGIGPQEHCKQTQFIIIWVELLILSFKLQVYNLQGFINSNQKKDLNKVTPFNHKF